MPDERAEFIAAVHQLTAFTEGLLALNERLVQAYDTDARPSVDELAARRAELRAGANSLKALNSDSRRQQFSARDRYHCSSECGPVHGLRVESSPSLPPLRRLREDGSHDCP
jgi:hypothetical protein